MDNKPKSGYEIRGDMIALAKEYWDKVTDANMTIIGTLSKQIADNNPLAQTAEYTNLMKKSMVLYTPEDILKLAEQFYGFVQNK